MSLHNHNGSASALPLASAYIEQGGRLIVSPKGELMAAGDMKWFSANTDTKAARRSFTVCRRFFRRLKDERFARSVKALVVANGNPTPNGWLELAA